MWQTHGDLIAEAQDWPEAQRFAERSKLLLPPPVLAAEQAKKEESPEVAMVKMQAEQAIGEKDQAINAAADEIERLRIENDKLKAQHELKAAEIKVKAFEAETDRMVAEANAANAQATTEIAAFTAANPVQAEGSEGSEREAPEMDIGAILQTVADMQNPATSEAGVQMAQASAQMVETNAQIANQLSEVAALLAQAITQPKHKTGRAVRQPDGSYVMESVEEVANVN